MKASRLFFPAVCALAGFGVGAFVYPGPYSYATSNGAVVSRVNRITGVEQFSSSRGWVSREEAVRDAMSGGFQGMGEALRAMGDSASRNATTTAPMMPNATAGSLGPPNGQE